MSIFMGLRDFFKKRGATKKVSPANRSPAGDAGDTPKNGRLTLAVIAVLLLMVVLAVLNGRLILDPSIARKAFGPWVPSRTDSGTEAAASTSCPTAEATPSLSPPQVTFYSKLLAQEEQARCSGKTGNTTQDSQENHEEPSKNASTEDIKPAEPNAEKRTAGREGLHAREEERNASVGASLPTPDSGTGTYMVQVGAFTNPSIAQQWAAKWKSRGYEVMLKPVARPRTGILYRLYLGKFSSQKEADDLVKRLKTREGITAFRLLVRN